MLTNPNQGSQPGPAKIMQIGMGFWASKVLLAAVKFKLFTYLAEKPLSAAEVKTTLRLNTTERHVYDWLDTLVSFGFLNRDGLLETAVYSNAEDTGMFLDQNKPSYIGGMLEMANNRLYHHWADLETGLLTGKPQNESKDSGEKNFFMELYKNPEKLQEFMDAMSGIQQGNFMALTKKFDFGKYKTIADIGGADGTLAIQICRNFPEVKCIVFDLPPVAPLAAKKISAAGMESRIEFVAGDFTNDPFPDADVYIMGNIIHGMNEEEKMAVIRKVFKLLPPGGLFMTLENIIDDDRKQNAFGLMMSLNMLIENGDAFDYTFADFRKWTSEAGFSRQELMPLAGPASAAIAYK